MFILYDKISYENILYSIKLKNFTSKIFLSNELASSSLPHSYNSSVKYLYSLINCEEGRGLTNKCILDMKRLLQKWSFGKRCHRALYIVIILSLLYFIFLSLLSLYLLF